MVVEFMLRGLKTKIDTDKLISLLKAGKDIENECIIGMIQELVAKCKALEPLNISILDLLSITDKQAKDIDRLEAELKQLKEENEKAKSNTHGINWELFDTGEIAVQCETEGNATEFLKEAINRGYSLDCSSLSWRLHKSDTCFRNKYVNDHCSILFCGKNYYESKGIKVVKWKPDGKEALYDALESVQIEAKKRINKLVSKIKKQKETIEFYKNQCEELRQSCNDLREENESIKNDKSELIIALKNTRDDIEMTIDYLDAIINGFTDCKENKGKEFDWDGFKVNNVAVNCRTPDEAIDFIKSAKKYVKKWYDGDRIENNTYWSVYKEETCYFYRRKSKGLLTTSLAISKRVNREILEWSDYMVKHDE